MWNYGETKHLPSFCHCIGFNKLSLSNNNNNNNNNNNDKTK